MAERVVVAMSGGVDSSVVAALLKQAGHEVIGVTFKAHDISESPHIPDARAVAEKLGITHHVTDFRDIFKEEIIKPFLEDYSRGITPNPCIRCNRRIKFGALMQKALNLDAVKLATGHYARVVTHHGKKMIARGRDSRKEQSYFLFTLTHDDLKSILFPIGDYSKTEVRSIARELDLPVADKKESLEVCFVPDNDYALLVEKYSGGVTRPGNIALSDGKVVGRHEGIHRFTVGQRRGLNVAMGHPMYVLSIDAENGSIVIGAKEECRSKGLVANGVVCNHIIPFEENMEVGIQIRYKTPPVKGLLFPIGPGRIKVIFTEETPLVTPGQAAVFYKDDLVLGGGWIEGPAA